MLFVSRRTDRATRRQAQYARGDESHSGERSRRASYVAFISESPKKLQPDLCYLYQGGQIEQLEGRLSVREAMRALEHWIAVQVVGSKNRVRDEGLYTVKALLNSRDYSQTLLQVCDRVHCNALTFLKKQGDTTAHRAASKDRLAQSINESDDTPEHKKVASDLVEMLDRFCMKEDKTFGWDPLATEAQNMA